MVIFAVILIFVVLLGTFTLGYQIFRLTALDAESRRLKHPKFWGIFSMNRLLLYIIGRKKYPSAMSAENKVIFYSSKKKAGVSLGFIAFGVIGFMIFFLFFI